MNNNSQVETLFKELKQILNEIEKTNNTKIKQELILYSEELKANIIDLSSSIEIDYEIVSKTMMLKATANALLYKICRKKELHVIISELDEIGVPNEVVLADKEILTKYLTQIEHPNPSKFERYHEFIRIFQNKSFKSSPNKKQEFLKDYNWLMDDNTLANDNIGNYDWDLSQFKKILDDKKNENFEELVDRYNHLLIGTDKI